MASEYVRATPSRSGIRMARSKSDKGRYRPMGFCGIGKNGAMPVPSYHRHEYALDVPRSMPLLTLVTIPGILLHRCDYLMKPQMQEDARDDQRGRHCANSMKLVPHLAHHGSTPTRQTKVDSSDERMRRCCGPAAHRLSHVNARSRLTFARASLRRDTYM